MDEHVLIADRRLDEPITLCRVEPLDGAFLHRLSPGLDVKTTRPRFCVPRHKRAFGCLLNFSVAKRTVDRPKIRLCRQLQHEICELASFRRGLRKIAPAVRFAPDDLWQG